ncbi:hypothetical protein AC578_7538 [Pseudocercospora eumusae]|uniref:Uncharacterized protein n=1 Tax=Pseudocercospora eumusae TaxID=321146 RepID=A0A139HRH8_9PEZI|nr:hypothetical protein AC578_7538 [Pseudocercospora eumusae]
MLEDDDPWRKARGMGQAGVHGRYARLADAQKQNYLLCLLIHVQKELAALKIWKINVAKDEGTATTTGLFPHQTDKPKSAPMLIPSTSSDTSDNDHDVAQPEEEHPVNAPHGHHHQFCSVHTNYYVRTGNPCDKCEEEAERQAKKERYERERAKKQRELEASVAWFKEDRKERKPRSVEKRK